jgi:hypothetical protein
MIQVRDGATTPVTTVVATRATLRHVRSTPGY